MNIQHIGPIIGTTLSVGAIIYQTGKHAHMLESMGLTVNALEKKDDIYNKTLCQMNGNISIMNIKLKNIENDIKDIKNNIVK